jgi:predicted SPOUT superfamily RNA methylase MTH1
LSIDIGANRKMRKYNRKLVVAIPASLVSDIPHLREKTLKIGLVGRAAAIFRVTEIIVYPDNPHTNQKRDRNLILTILSYMETPQYLRKRLFKIKPTLRYAGILPPLRTPHHPLAKRAKELKVGEYREGVAIAVTRLGSLVDVGVDRPVLFPNRELDVNTRITVQVIKSGKHPKIALANCKEIEAYWGYSIKASQAPLGQLIKSRTYDLVIATSNLGTPLMEVAYELAERWKNSNSVLVVFGAPAQGLQEIVAQENLELEKITDFTVNTIPDQGTKTVRTEEALYASLALFNAITR